MLVYQRVDIFRHSESFLIIWQLEEKQRFCWKARRGGLKKFCLEPRAFSQSSVDSSRPLHNITHTRHILNAPMHTHTHLLIRANHMHFVAITKMLLHDMLQKICIGHAKAYNSELPLRRANGTSMEQIVIIVWSVVCNAMCNIHNYIHMILYAQMHILYMFASRCVCSS